MSDARFVYVSGPDDFLASRLARKVWEEMRQGVEDDFSAEIVNGQAGKVDEVADAVNRLREATQTIGLFGGRRVVWLKDVTSAPEALLETHRLAWVSDPSQLDAAWLPYFRRYTPAAS